MDEAAVRAQDMAGSLTKVQLLLNQTQYKLLVIHMHLNVCEIC